MKILVLANNDMGLYKFRKELLNTLAERAEVFFCIPNGEFVKDICALGCEYIQCDCLIRRSTNPLRDLKLVHFYRNILSDIKPDVVLTYTIKPNVYGGYVCSKLGIPYIANVTGLGTAIENGGILQKITTSMYKVGLAKASCVFFQNGSNRDFFLSKKLVSAKTRLIPGSGVNVDDNCYEEYPEYNDGVKFLFIGRIMKDKGIEELLTAIQEIHLLRKDVSLDIIGDCEENYVGNLDEMSKIGIITYHGRQNDVHSFIKKCHCVVLPSYHEGMANVLLEAASTGRPVIASRIPGCKETFDEGITGLGCEAKDSESLKAAMMQFLEYDNSKREQMGKAAREKVVRKFNRQIVIDSYLEEIEAIL